MIMITVIVVVVIVANVIKKVCLDLDFGFR